MVIDNFYIKRIFALSPETYPPLVIYANTVEDPAIVFQRFQMIAIGNSQIIQASGLIQQQQFSPSHALNLTRQSPGRFIIEYLFSFEAGKAPYHLQRIITSCVIDVKETARTRNSSQINL